MSTERAPSGLATAGRTMWRRTVDEYELNPGELQVLEQACRTVDELVVLAAALVGQPPTVLGSTGQPRAHPLYAELRAHRKTLENLIGELGLPMPDEASGRPRTAAARRAVRARWNREARRGLRAVGDGAS